MFSPSSHLRDFSHLSVKREKKLKLKLIQKAQQTQIVVISNDKTEELKAKKLGITRFEQVSILKLLQDSKGTNSLKNILQQQET